MKTFTAESSQGTYTGDAATGELVGDGSYDDGKLTILRFDVAEWRKKYPDESLDGMSLDILDLGYWYRDNETGREEYTEPAHDWRAEFRPVNAGARVFGEPAQEEFEPRDHNDADGVQTMGDFR